ncbi:hypothetical protein UlMin_045919 [Ulmus minor]
MNRFCGDEKARWLTRRGNQIWSPIYIYIYMYVYISIYPFMGLCLFPPIRSSRWATKLKPVKTRNEYKGIFIPPLPEKSAVENFRFSAEFIEMRRQGLDIFVNRVASHHELQQSEDLRTFLLRSQETGIFKKKPSDLMQIFKDVQTKVSEVVLRKEKPIEESNPEYEKLKHYLGQSLSDFGKAAKLLGACEDNALGKVFTDLGTKSKLLSIKLQKEAQQLLMNFEEPLKDYVRVVQSIKATIAERANAFKQQCELTETIKLKEINLYVYAFILFYSKINNLYVSTHYFVNANA